ncbi:MAG: hypothetical protein AAF235_05745 [Planctomycetota bacterium]
MRAYNGSVVPKLIHGGLKRQLEDASDYFHRLLVLKLSPGGGIAFCGLPSRSFLTESFLFGGDPPGLGRAESMFGRPCFKLSDSSIALGAIEFAVS